MATGMTFAKATASYEAWMASRFGSNSPITTLMKVINDTTITMLNVAAGTLTEDAFAAWLRQHARPRA